MSSSKERYAEYLNSDYWLRVSDIVKAKAGYRCQVCNSPHDLQAHHRCYDHRGHELDHIDDLTCLCRRCHSIFHGKNENPNEAFAKETVAPRKPEWIKARGEFKKQISNKKALFDSKVERMAVERAENAIDSVWVDSCMAGLSDPVILTAPLVDNVRANGSFTSATISALGIPKSEMSHGWADRLIGKSISLTDYRQALRGKFIYSGIFRILQRREARIARENNA